MKRRVKKTNTGQLNTQDSTQVLYFDKNLVIEKSLQFFIDLLVNKTWATKHIIFMAKFDRCWYE